MKVFISSLISGFEVERRAARRAVTSLRHEPVMAEDFGARPDSPQIACLQQLRGSDVVVLVLGTGYGFVPPGSGLSATHQEYREAQKTKTVLAFIQQGVTPDPEQARFIEEVQGWEGGLFRAGFTGPEELQQTAMFGPNRLFDRSKGIEAGLSGGDLVIRQERSASIRLTEQGSMMLRVPLDDPEPAGRMGLGGMMAIIEEAVQQRLVTTLAFVADTMERIDSTQRLTHLAVAASISGAEYRAWRTRAQNEASPNSMQIGMTGQRERRPVTLAVRRAALRLDRSNLIEDILVPLRRQFPSG